MRGGLRANEEVYKRINDWRERATDKVTARKDKSGGHSSAGRAPALHAGGRRFDPVWLHQFLAVICCYMRSLQKKTKISFEDLLLFNNLENSDVLMGEFFEFIQFKCRICTSYDTVQLHD